MMDEQSSEELDELQDPNTWEDEGDVRPPVRSPRAVVSVAFPREDFQRIASYAKRHGMKTSEFIRQAALECSAPPSSHSEILAVTGRVKTGFPATTSNKSQVKVKTKPEDSYVTA